MAEEIDLDRLHFSLGCITTADPVQEFYLTKDEVRDLIQDVSVHGLRVTSVQREGRGPINSRGLGFAVEWSEDEAVVELK